MATDRDALATFFAEQGLSAGHSPHSWRCEYPDRYGDCTCVEEMITDLLASDWLAQHDAEVREATKAGIAEAIEAFCYLKRDGDEPCDAELHARIAREWEPEVGTDG